MSEESVREAVRQNFSTAQPFEASRAWNLQFARAERFRKRFRGKRWDELDSAFLLKNYEALAYLSPQGFAYYLPAFLLLAMERTEESHVVRRSLVTMLAFNGKEKDAFSLGLEAARELARNRPEYAEMVQQVEDLTRRAMSLPLPPPTDIFQALEIEQRAVIESFLAHLREEFADEFVGGDLERAIEAVSVSRSIRNGPA